MQKHPHHHANNQKLQPRFKQYSTSPKRYVKYYVMDDGNYFASDKPLNADFSPMNPVPATMEMLHNASWEPQSVSSISTDIKIAIETDSDVTGTIQDIKAEAVSYAQFQQSSRKMLKGNATYSGDTCLV